MDKAHHNENSRFEAEYSAWLRDVAGGIAQRLLRAPHLRREELIRSYRDLTDTGSVFRPCSQSDKIARLMNGRTDSCVILETDAVNIFPSLSARSPGVLDFTIALSRRLYCQKLWFSVISINSTYLEASSDKMLAFTLEHELEMIRIYEEISADIKKSDSVVSQGLRSHEGTLGITPDDLREDERLVLSIADTKPLLPKPYSELAMIGYLERNISTVRERGIPSKNAEEEAFGSDLYEEFSGWSSFTRKSYQIYVSEIKARMRDAFRGYA